MDYAGNIGYDTVKICLNAEGLLPHMEKTVQGFEYIEEGIKGRARVNGLEIYADRFKMVVEKGSLCKFYHGNNLRALTRTDTKQAIELLSDTLALPMAQGMIWRLDIGSNLLTAFPPEVYFKDLGELPYFKRETYTRSGLRYHTAQRQLVFYDKIKELKMHGESIPDDLLGKNLLRYELRHGRGFAKRVGVAGGVPVSMIYDEDFFNEMCDRWREMYGKIRKENYKETDLSEIMKKRKQPRAALQTIMVQAGIKAYGGVSATIDYLKQERSKGTLTPKQYYSLCAYVREIGNLSSSAAAGPSDAIQELDTLILGG